MSEGENKLFNFLTQTASRKDFFFFFSKNGISSKLAKVSGYQYQTAITFTLLHFLFVY